MQIIHNSWKTEYRDPFGAAKTGSPVRISMDIVGEGSFDVTLRAWQDGIGESLIDMTEAGSFGSARRFSTVLKMPGTCGIIWYYFIVRDGDNVFYLGNNPENTGGEGMMHDHEPSSFQITVYKDLNVPKWYKDGIVYQIFPDRFARDDNWKERAEKAISKRNHRIADNPKPFDELGCQEQFIEEDWSRPAYYVKNEDGDVTAWPFYGGSFKGIESKLDYLSSLGISAIYLNPVFEAVSNHRYDTADYMQVDPILGTEEEFESLIRNAEIRGISIILDGVFSHTGADSRYFDKYGNYGNKGAFNDPDSQFRYLYKFDEKEPTGYKCWWGVKDLPEVDENNVYYRQMICGDKGVIRKWTGKGIKGWRLDVADELPDSFIRDIRKSLKSIDEDNLLIGEVWEDASNKVSYGEKRQFLMGEELDGTMNYPLRLILLDYINYTVSGKQAADRIMSLRENYPEECFYGALNLIGSHDRERILSLMAYDEDPDSALRKVKILSALQYALPGVPCIYYGDEAGMTGGTDPENRNAYPWMHENEDMKYHYRMLGLIYNEHPALKNGSISFLSGHDEAVNDDVLAFVRSDENEKLLVLVNRSYSDTELDLSGFDELKCGSALELLRSEDVDMRCVHLERLSANIIYLKDKFSSEEAKPRKSGVICHISSLPGGVLGKPAREFVDWLVRSGMNVWQVLPINPTGTGNCPYNSYSAFAGNPDFINKNELPSMDGFLSFYNDNRFWLDDFTEYMCLRENVTEENRNAYKKETVIKQYCFDSQWKDLKNYANSHGIKIMGDLPMFVAADSADVMFNSRFFISEKNSGRAVHAGVPPDDFNDEGQDWGLALYDWDELKKDGYSLWIHRLKQCAERYDILRLDHFRAFSEYYEVPDGRSPKEGCWHHGPGADLFRTVNDNFRKEGISMEIIAEDLGILDAGVKNLIALTGYPGMNIWQFSYDEMMEMTDEIASGRAFYTGTHDNQTLVGWLTENYPESTTDEIRKKATEIIKTIFSSKAEYAMLPLQDVFLLGDESRMNVPGVPEGNWKWQIPGSNIENSFEYGDMITAWFRTLNMNTDRGLHYKEK